VTARAWAGPALQVVGLGLSGEALAPAARAALQDAELLIGAPRHFAALTQLGLAFGGQREHFPSPFAQLWTLLQANQGRRIALLASGDPLFFGLGGHLRKHLPAESLIFHPAVSSVQAAFARIGQPWQQAEVVSLHGRPLLGLRARLRGGRWYAALTDASSHPAAVAAELVAAGFGESAVWVCEDLGSPEERIRAFAANALALLSEPFSPLNVLLFQTRGGGGVLPEFPGIADEAFSSDGDGPGKGLLTKREVRLCVLSLLAPRAGDVGWDIGAGCGGVAVEWARWCPLGQVHALEKHPRRLEHLAINRERFGVLANLQIHPGSAPAALSELPEPSVIFVGGGGRELPQLLVACWQRLPSGGRLVASAVTEEARLALHQFAGSAGEWIQLAVSRGDSLAGQRLLRPQLPVLLLKRVKP